MRRGEARPAAGDGTARCPASRSRRPPRHRLPGAALRISSVPALPGLDLQQAVQRLSLAAGGLAQTLGRPPGGSRQGHPLAKSFEDRYHSPQYGCLAGSRSARQNEDLLRHGLVDRLPLFPGQFHSHPAAGPVHGGRSVELPPLLGAGHQGPDGIGHGPLSKVEASEKDGLSIQHDPSRLPQDFPPPPSTGPRGGRNGFDTAWTSSSLGVKTWPSPACSSSRCSRAAWARWGECSSIPICRAILSAVMKPIPRTSWASR